MKGSVNWTVSVNSIGAFEPPFGETATTGNYRVSIGDTLRVFVPAGSLVNQKNVRLSIENGVGVIVELSGTHDALGNLTFEWTANPDTAGLCEFSFLYSPYAETTTSNSLLPTKKSVVNKVLVEPTIHINGVQLPPTALSVQTVISRCLGPINTWIDKLRSATAQLHYNVIHFTPVQTTGASGSCYSIADHLKIMPELLPESLCQADPEQGWRLLQTVVKNLEKSCGLLSTCDIVLNHTADNTPWLGDHPECGYTVANTPHLAGALDLDLQLQEFSKRVARDEFRDQGVSSLIQDTQSLESLCRLVKLHVIDPFKLHEWFELPIDAILKDFHNVPLVPHVDRLHHPQLGHHATLGDPLDTLFNDCLRSVGVTRRTGVRPDLTLLRDFSRDAKHARELLLAVQEKLYEESRAMCDAILNAIKGYVLWERIECHRGPIGEHHSNALVPRYFTPVADKTGQLHYLANNGWVMGWDALKDFTSPGSSVYLNRSLVCWSDCVKLRYGDKRDDAPFLWDYMAQYCRKTASTFFGVRLDNCHSTPLHVAKFCLQQCRKVNPEVWVYAELFTGNQEVDLKFERELGLNAFIREALQSSSCADLAYHVLEYSNSPIGKLSTQYSLQRFDENPKQATLSLVPTMGTSLFFDCTHDNEVPYQKRTACDALPNAAAVAASACAIGSSRGYDELIPRNLSVVTERRAYYDYSPQSASDKTASETAGGVTLRTTEGLDFTTVHVVGSWDGWTQRHMLTRDQGAWAIALTKVFASLDGQPGNSDEYQYKFVGDEHVWFHDPSLPQTTDNYGNINNVLNNKAPRDASQWRKGFPLPGMMEPRKKLNQLHLRLITEEFTECSAEVLSGSTMVVKRHQPRTHQLCLFYLHCAFSAADITRPVQPLVHHFKGRIVEVAMEACLSVPIDAHFSDSPEAINGLPSCLELAEGSDRNSSKLHWFHTCYNNTKDETTVTFHKFVPGSVVIFFTEGCPHVAESVQNVILDIGSILGRHVSECTISREAELQAYSYILYSCSNEEQERSKGVRGCYSLPKIGDLPYAGIAGVIFLLDEIRYAPNPFDHPLLQNICAGNWLFDYLTDRLDSETDDAFQNGVLCILLNVATWMREAFREPLRYLPRRLLPYYFDWIVSTLYSWIARRVMAGCCEPLRRVVDPFISLLYLATLQFYSYVPSAPLFPNTTHPSLAAGLPHFSTGFMRCWGRDTFIAFKGCFLIPERYDMARDELLAYARVVRHGLIPNLLDSGNHPRYNARDATWFFLQSIQDYCEEAPDKLDFLKTLVELKTPLESHSPWAQQCFPERSAPFKTVTVAELIHYLLASHVFGIKVREWNAGPSLDAHMQDQGFQLSICVDRDTGIVYGGNAFNCGTWMDKMGSSSAAKNKGIPATPRDGAAVEINGLVKSTLRFVNRLPEEVFPFSRFKFDNNFTYVTWENRLQQYFDYLFYIPCELAPPVRKVQTTAENQNLKLAPHLNASLVHRRGIYRDTLKASEAWRDYQLRPNFCIMLAVAPELCPSVHVESALSLVSSLLMSMKPFTSFQEEVDKFQSMKGRDAIEVVRALAKNNIFPGYTRQLGLKTLDPSDYTYNGNYNNDDHSTNAATAEGFNYHNGPEWVWPVGYFLQAKKNVALALNSSMSTANSSTAEKLASGNKSDDLRFCLFDAMRYVHTLRQHIIKNRWLSLPEITNANGEFCPFGCPAQAWSVATILAALRDLAATCQLSTHTVVTSKTIVEKVI